MAKIKRTQNASRNIFFGVILRAYTLVVPFAMRTVMIHYLGMEYLGLNSLFTSILHVLNLAELGVGSAMVYSMYKPIAEDDIKKISSLMKLYRTYYRIIGLVIAVSGAVITPFVPKLIKGTVPPDINVYVLYLLNLGTTVLSYWLFAYRNCLFAAHQRLDVRNKIYLATDTLKYIIQLLVLCLLRNYYYYVIAALVTQVLTNVVVAIASKKQYPDFHASGDLDKEERKQINQRIKDLFTSRVGSVVYNSVDTIVISSFLGLKILAMYNNYYFVITSITSFITIIFSSCTAGIGNSVIVESKEKNYKDLQKFTFIICWISGFCSTCFLCLFQPFMELWVGKTNMLDLSAVICFVVYFYVRQINSLLNLYKDASGIWHEDRFRPLIAAMTNLILNLILVQFIGIFGILLSTVVAILFVGVPWLCNNLFTYVFEKKYVRGYVKRLLIYTVIIVLSCTITYLLCELFEFGLIPTIAVRLAICCIIPNSIFFAIFRKSDVFKSTLVLVNVITKGHLRKLLIILGLGENNESIRSI